MSANEPPQVEQVEDEQELDIEALLERPEEKGEFECSVPEEVADEFAEEEEGLQPRPVQPIAATCLREFSAIRRSGTRSLSTIRLIVIHCTESDAARGSARWFTDSRTKGSAHLIVDDRECYRTLADEVIPHAAPGANTIGWHLELTGHAKWKREKWLDHKETLRRGAFKAALHAKKFGIPIRLLSAADIRLGRKGFVTHALCTQAFHTKNGHTDPGRGCPLDQFMEMTQKFRDTL